MGLVTLVWPAACLAQAAAPDEAGAAAATAPGDVVVTANRATTPIWRVGQSITVLTESQIQADQETDVADILARTPGIALARNGGPGQTTSLFIRGAESDQTLVLIDGVKVNDSSDPGDGFDFANLLAGDVARLEVLRGPQSTLYGSEAIGGVVNVITAEPTKPFQGDARLEGGSYGTAYAKLGLGGKETAWDWRLSAWYSASDGVSAFDRGFGGVGSDPVHSAGASGRIRWRLAPDIQIDQRGYFSFSRAEFDGYDTPTYAFGNDDEYGRVWQAVDYTGLNVSLWGGRLKNRLAYEYTALDRTNEDPQQVGSKFTFIGKGRADTVEYEGTLSLAPGYAAVFGAQTERSTINSQAPLYEAVPNEAATTLNSGYAQISGEIAPGLTLTGGGRYDDQTGVGGHPTAQASAAWRLNGGATILRASFGQGFKAPSLYELYSEYGNAALKPESANGWDAGIEQHLFGDRVILQARYFGRITNDLINFVSCYGVTTGGCATNTSGGYYDNVGRAEAEGAELQASWRASRRLSFDAQYTLDRVTDETPGSPTFGFQLARRPVSTASATASYLWPFALRTDLALRYAGQSYDDDAHDNVLAPYVLMDLRASYPIREGLEIYARIENLTDRHYETVYQYGTLGRAAYAGVRVTF